MNQEWGKVRKGFVLEKCLERKLDLPTPMIASFQDLNSFFYKKLLIGL